MTVRAEKDSNEFESISPLSKSSSAVGFFLCLPQGAERFVLVHAHHPRLTPPHPFLGTGTGPPLTNLGLCPHMSCLRWRTPAWIPAIDKAHGNDITHFRLLQWVVCAASQVWVWGILRRCVGIIVVKLSKWGNFPGCHTLKHTNIKARLGCVLCLLFPLRKVMSYHRSCFLFLACLTYR